MRKQSARTKNVLTDIVPPVNGYECATVTHWVTVVPLGQEIMNAAIDHLRPNATNLILFNEGDSENMHASWSKRAGDFPKSLLGIQDVLEDILRDMKIDSAIGEREPFKIFIPHAIHILLITLFGKKLAADVIRTFSG